MELLVKRLREGAVLPFRATPGSAGYDLTALPDGDIVLPPGGIALIPTGLAVAPTRGDVVLLVYARSSLAVKFGVTLANSVGVVDADYRGELKVPLVNLGGAPFTVHPGDRIAQLIVTPILTPAVVEAGALPDTLRSTGGFGSTGPGGAGPRGAGGGTVPPTPLGDG